MDKTGMIYILINPAFPEYVKIGHTGNIDKWLQQLNRSECIPFVFRDHPTHVADFPLSDL